MIETDEAMRHDRIPKGQANPDFDGSRIAENVKGSGSAMMRQVDRFFD